MSEGGFCGFGQEKRYFSDHTAIKCVHMEGAALMPQIICPKCGSEIPEGTIICPNCQFDIRDYNQEAEEELTALLNSQKVSGDDDDEQGETDASSSGETPPAENNVRAGKKKSAPKPEEGASAQPAEQPAEAESA
ncbi:MAG: hypothetical protein K2N29_01455, partial [Ruminiclostridium sp.]|nr:hypothetical protein [Ruminiclostridium sp.]